MGLEIEAIYENGVLKLMRELPLVEGAAVRITIHPPGRPGLVTHTRIPRTGSTEELNASSTTPTKECGGHRRLKIFLPLRPSSWTPTLSSTPSTQTLTSGRLVSASSSGSTTRSYTLTRPHVVAEMAHRLMTLETASILGRSPSGLANWLKRHPAEVQRLARDRKAIDELTLIGVQVLPVTGSQVSLAADISRQSGLLTNDAVIVIVMRDHGLTLLASHDADFDRVPGITRYAPA